jgi:hypothetical protein
MKPIKERVNRDMDAASADIATQTAKLISPCQDSGPDLNRINCCSIA